MDGQGAGPTRRPSRTHTNSGGGKVFEWVPDGSGEPGQGRWAQLGNAVHGSYSNDRMGEYGTMSADGNTIFLTSRYGRGTDHGHEGYGRIYRWNETHWTQLGHDLRIDDNEHHTYFGNGQVSVTGDGTRVCIASHHWSYGYGESNKRQHAGLVAVYDYIFHQDAWTQTYAAYGSGSYNYFGQYGCVLTEDGTLLSVSMRPRSYEGTGYYPSEIRFYALPMSMVCPSPPPPPPTPPAPSNPTPRRPRRRRPCS